MWIHFVYQDDICVMVVRIARMLQMKVKIRAMEIRAKVIRWRWDTSVSATSGLYVYYISDKLQCDDGRCIPIAWCCDRHHDPNCSVTIRPPCCQLLSDRNHFSIFFFNFHINSVCVVLAYEETEYGYVPYKVNHVKSNGGRYLFISVCKSRNFYFLACKLKRSLFIPKQAY